MSRPLTVADRAPEVGDELRRGEFTYRVDEVDHDSILCLWTSHKVQKPNGRFDWQHVLIDLDVYNRSKLEYLSRRDNGPTTTQEEAV